MPRIEDVLSPRNLVDYTKKPPVAPMKLEELFPESKQTELQIEMIKGGNGNPVIASIHAFDSEAQIGSREGFTGDLAELALTKRKFRLKEKDLIALLTPRTDREATLARDRVYDDVDRLILSIKARFEKMRGDVLATGKQVINENGYHATIDYGVPNTHKGNLSWSTGTPDILGDIYTLCNTITGDTGFTPVKALTSTKVVNIMLRDDKVRAAAFGTEKDRILTLPGLNQLLTSMGLPKIAVYDARYRKENAKGNYVTARYFDEDTITFMPDGKMGDTFYGPTAEELKLVKNNTVDASMIDKIAMVHYTTEDPVADWVKAAATGMVTFPYADQVFIGKVQ